MPIRQRHNEIRSRLEQEQGSSGDENETELHKPAGGGYEYLSEKQIWPDILSALRERDGVSSAPSKSAIRKIGALKRNQQESILLEARFHEEVHRLESKYGALFGRIWARREAIIDGSYRPTEEDEKFGLAKVGGGFHGELYKTMSGDRMLSDKAAGVPGFWLAVLKNAKMTAHLIKPDDEPPLKALHNIEIHYRPADPMGFTLLFRFGKNDYFANSVLSKQYEMRCRPEENYPHAFEGPEIFATRGSTIDWYRGRNLTLKVVKRRGCSRRGVRRRAGWPKPDSIQHRIVRNESFFNSFGITGSVEDPQLDEEKHEELVADFETANYIRERVLPRAVVFFTRDAPEEESEDDDSDEEEEEDESTGEELSDEFESEGENAEDSC